MDTTSSLLPTSYRGCGARPRTGEARSGLARGDRGIGGGSGIYSVLVEARPRRQTAGRCFWWAQSCGCGSGEHREKSKPGLCRPAKATLLAPAFLVVFADALPY